jgi:hypothetical protein
MSGPDLQRIEPQVICLRSITKDCMASAILWLASILPRSAPPPPAIDTSLVEEMDWEPERAPTIPSLRQAYETPDKTRSPALRSSKTIEFAASTPPSPLDDWTRFKNDIMTEVKPVTISPPTLREPVVRPAAPIRRYSPLSTITSDTFRIGYAFSALVRVLAIVATLTVRTTTLSKGFLAEGPSIIEMASSAGSGLAQRQMVQVSLATFRLRWRLTDAVVSRR